MLIKKTLSEALAEIKIVRLNYKDKLNWEITPDDAAIELIINFAYEEKEIKSIKEFLKLLQKNDKVKLFPKIEKITLTENNFDIKDNHISLLLQFIKENSFAGIIQAAFTEEFQNKIEELLEKEKYKEFIRLIDREGNPIEKQKSFNKKIIKNVLDYHNGRLGKSFETSYIFLNDIGCDDEDISFIIDTISKNEKNCSQVISLLGHAFTKKGLNILIKEMKEKKYTTKILLEKLHAQQNASIEQQTLDEIYLFNKIYHNKIFDFLKEKEEQLFAWLKLMENEPAIKNIKFLLAENTEIEKIVNILKQNKNITHLTFDSGYSKSDEKNIDDKVAEKIKELLIRSDSNKCPLFSLTLKMNQLSEAGLLEISESLKENKNLAHLSIESKSIKKLPSDTFFDNLRKNKTLVGLSLKNITILSTEAIAFIEKLGLPTKKKPNINRQQSLTQLKIEINAGHLDNLIRNNVETLRNQKKTKEKITVDITNFVGQNTPKSDKLFEAIGKDNEAELEKILKEASLYVKHNTYNKTLFEIAMEKDKKKCIDFLLKKDFNLKILPDEIYLKAVELKKEFSERKQSTFIPKNEKKRKMPEEKIKNKKIKEEIAGIAETEEIGEIGEIGEMLELSSFDDSTDKETEKTISCLHSIVDELKNISKESPQYSKLIEKAYDFIKKAKPADRELLQEDSELECKDMSVLNRAVAYGQYRLAKLILNSSLCDINHVDGKEFSALTWAIENRDSAMLDRLLITPYLGKPTIKNAFEAAKKIKDDQESKKITPYIISPIEKIISLLEKHLKFERPENPGVQWTKEFSVSYGSRPESQRTLTVEHDDLHAGLIVKNSFSNRRLFFNYSEKNSQEDSQHPKKFTDNPVTASLTFVTSKNTHKKSSDQERQIITINLDFKEEYHINEGKEGEDSSVISEEKLEKIKKRADFVSNSFQDLFKKSRSNNPPKHSIEITEKYEEKKKNPQDPNFAQEFHHGEQSLLDDLVTKKRSQEIVKRLLIDKDFVSGAKIYAIILNIHSPNYVCANCEVGILGEQNGYHSEFVKNISQQLQQKGCVLPYFSPLRMLTQISSYKAFEQDQVTEEDHKQLFVDLRNFKTNNFILTQDLNSLYSKPENIQSTQYNSTNKIKK